VFLFLRKAKLLVVRELAVDPDGRLYELRPDSDDRSGLCPAVPVLHLEGSLFFGAAGELQGALDQAAADPAVRAMVVRLKRTQLLDATTAAVLAETAERMRARGQHLILAGMRRDAMRVLERTGVAERIGPDNLFPTQPAWFVAMGHAIDRALELAGEHACGSACPLLRRRTGQVEV
jgi:SulP family sulfate permease